jgi:hypothetical protein
MKEFLGGVRERFQCCDEAEDEYPSLKSRVGV